MFDFLKKKITKGGSQILRYKSAKKTSEVIGFVDEVDVLLQNARVKVSDGLFGECEIIGHEFIPLKPHIDIRIYKPGFHGRDFYTLVTSGMSDLPMTVHAGVPEQYQRAEIIMYVDEPKDEYLKLLHEYARTPHDFNTFFAHGHTVPNGQPADPLFKGSELDTVFFMPTILSPDDRYPEFITQESGIALQLLHLMPITTIESDYKLEKGTNALYDVFAENDLPFVLNEARKSYL